MKLDFSQEEFIHKCKLVADFNPAFLPILDDKDGINQSFFCLMRNNANQREIPFEITKRDVWDQFCRQGGVCALSGIPLKLPSYTESIEDKASLDRIDSAKRIYNLENVQFVHKDINLMKWKFDQDYFKDWCKKVAAHNS